MIARARRPLKPVYNEETALAAALKESEQEEAFDRIAKQLEQSKIEEEGEAEESAGGRRGVRGRQRRRRADPVARGARRRQNA